jgi:hypothetical protein
LTKKKLIQLTIQGLKERLDENSNLIIQKNNGTIQKVKCEFNEPTTLENIKSFEEETKWKIPEDLQSFYMSHNGALIFEGEYGGGLEIYSLENISQNHLPHMPQKYYPIGYYEGEYLFVDSDKAQKNELRYLLWDDSSSPVDKWQKLNVNFEIWLDRFIVSQGSYFWEWDKMNLEKFYDN